MKAHSNELNSAETDDIVNKNKRRRESLEGLRSVIKDEVNHHG